MLQGCRPILTHTPPGVDHRAHREGVGRFLQGVALVAREDLITGAPTASQVNVSSTKRSISPIYNLSALQVRILEVGLKKLKTGLKGAMGLQFPMLTEFIVSICRWPISHRTGI